MRREKATPMPKRGHERRHVSWTSGGMADRPLAVVTGASSGIGRELATVCARNGFDLVIAADDPAIADAADALDAIGASVAVVETDLATRDGVELLHAAAQGRPIDALLANAGHGLSGAFLDQPFDEVRHVIDTNVTGTLYLIQLVGAEMRARGQGRILITGSIAGSIPGTYTAVYNGSKAFIDSFAHALRQELKDSGVTVSLLMPGPTDTEFFERAGMQDTRFGEARKDDATMVAEAGFDAMMRGEADVVTGWKNKIQTTIANVTPPGVLAAYHGRMAAPGSAKGHRDDT
jgi:short-subunit dehydrogenase